MKYVLIGNSTAGVAAIEGIRSVDQQGEITVISSENHHCYGRPTISYFLKGDIKRENMNYRPADFYEKNGVELLLGKTADRVDAENQEVVLSDGTKIAYDKLLIATGSRPFIPKIEGLNRTKSFSFMTYDDMLALDKAVAKNKNVLVIGAGLIGLKCVEGIVDRVKSVTVVDLADRVLPSVLDSEGAAFVQNKLQEKGMQFVLNDSVVEIAKNSAKLKSGKEISFDIVVTAVGVIPNTELLKSIGAECNRGIIIDTYGRTSIKNIYAAGDCAEGFDSSVGKNRVLALLPNAYYQGECAGKNMAGESCCFKNAIPMNAVGFFGLHVLSAGSYEGECIKQTSEDGYKKLFIKDGKLVGFIIIGNIERAGIYTSLVCDKTDLGTVNLELLFKEPQLSAFSEDMRKLKLARRV